MATGLRKLYYSISEVAELTGLEPHVLRFWESEFDRLHPKKNRAGNRAYTASDIEVVKRIQRLLRDEKYTIEGARLALTHELRGERRPSGENRRQLNELRGFLTEMLDGIKDGG